MGMAQLVRLRPVHKVAGSIPVQGNIFKNLFKKCMNSQVQQTHFFKLSNKMFIVYRCAVKFFNAYIRSGNTMYKIVFIKPFKKFFS